MNNIINKIHTLGPKNTNCEKAAYNWFKAQNINGTVILHNSLETALSALKKENLSTSALLGCIVYPDLHKIVFSNLNKLALIDIFIDNTYDMILASKQNNINNIKTVSTHPAPSGLITENFPQMTVTFALSNSDAAKQCANNLVDACITTSLAAKEHNLTTINNYGPVPMGFTIHTLKQ